MREIVRWYLAIGIDPTRHVIYAQSSVPEITELSWLLACMTSMNWLDDLPHFKEKAGETKQGSEGPNAGLYTYPVLMAADILGPHAHIVPVGEDQHPHVELTRKLARRFNTRVGEDFFPIPELMEHPAVRVPGLKGSGKMGKSHPESTINLVDEPADIKRRCQRADKKMPAVPGSNPDPMEPRVGAEPGEPDICRVFQLHAMLPGDASTELRIRSGCRDGTLTCGSCKVELGDRVVGMFAPMQARYREIAGYGDDYVDTVLEDGGKRARARIAPIVARAKELMGVRSF
jgi:tryptophanyl-tRNA synthetase